MPSVPRPKPKGGPRSTLPGVAPPPTPVPRPELAPEPPSEPDALLDDAEIVEAEVVEIPAPPPAAEHWEFPASPTVDAKKPAPPPSAELSLAQLRELKKRRSATVLIERPKKKASYVWVWLVVGPIILAGIAAWYVRRPPHRVAKPHATAQPAPSESAPPPVVSTVADVPTAPSASVPPPSASSAPKKHPHYVAPRPHPQPRPTSGDPITL